MSGTNSTAVAIVAGAALIAGAVLYSSGALKGMLSEPDHIKAVRDRLFDPASAEFRNVRTGSRIDVWCGEVNSKNRMGGYVGWRAFVAFPPIDGRPSWNVTIDDGSALEIFDPCKL